MQAFALGFFSIGDGKSWYLARSAALSTTPLDISRSRCICGLSQIVQMRRATLLLVLVLLRLVALDLLAMLVARVELDM
jgi:hypothetical protein